MELVDGWARHLRRSGKRANTIRCYVSDVRAFERHLGSTDLSSAGEGDVRAFLASSLEGGLTSATVLRRYRSLDGFFDWMVSRRRAERNPVAAVPVPNALEVVRPPATAAEVAALLGSCAGRRRGRARTATPTFADRRDMAMILVLLTTGLRASELVSITVADVPGDGTTLMVRGARRERVIRLLPSPARAMRTYVEARTNHPKASAIELWIGSGGPLTESGVRQAIARRCAAIGLRRLRTHDFRAAYAIEALRHGATDAALMGSGGWRTSTMFKRYRVDAGVGGRAAG